jgi:hypothetical protein
MREIIELFEKNNSNLVTPGLNLCVDEQLYCYRGRCNFKQYMPSKPAKYGLKYWTIAYVESSFVLSAKLYLRKNENKSNNEKKIGENVVLNLAIPFMNKKYRILTADNFFSSINLAKILFEKNIGFIGTLRKNKKEIPTAFLTNKNRVVDSSLFGFNDQLTLISYVPKKNKCVIILSTAHNKIEINTDTKKPEAVLYYNKTKGGVDTVDHLIENFTCRRKTNRWTFNVLMYLLDLAAHNSYCMLKIKGKNFLSNNKNKERRMQLEALSLALIDPLIKLRSEKISRNPVGFHTALIESFKRTGHKINKIVDDDKEKSKLKSTRKRCYLCSGKDNKYSKNCSDCKKNICPEHSHEHMTIYCNSCFYN